MLGRKHAPFDCSDIVARLNRDLCLAQHRPGIELLRHQVHRAACHRVARFERAAMRIEAGERGCTVIGSAGTWNSPEDWSAEHNA